MAQDCRKDPRFWVLDQTVDDITRELLGESRLAADALQGVVGLLIVADEPIDPDDPHRFGADVVVTAKRQSAGQETRLHAAEQLLLDAQPRLVMLRHTCEGREWASRLAARMDWNLASPALMATAREGLVCVTALDKTERRSRLLSFGRDETVVVTMRPGVAEPIPQDSNRQGEHRALQGDSQSEAIEGLELVPPDTRTVDIRHSERLVSGGRGVGGKEGFEALWRFADNINSAVSASRMAVDLGWIDRERQVGQTGRTVKPELYIACGISGASHHLAGMSESTHIVAVNTDAEAPIFKTAHLGIAADLHEVLDEAGKMLA